MPIHDSKAAIISIVALLFVLQNTESVRFNFLWFDFRWPLWAMLLVFMAIGFESLEDGAMRDLLMQRILEWFGGPTVGVPVAASAPVPADGAVFVAVDADLGNTYAGVNYFLQPLQDKPRVLQNHRLMLNYVVASGDTEEWAGIGGYRDDLYMFQYQIKF